jgi:rfaE bifunctional protein nucleotidyltransferase chain/domain
MIVTLKDLAQIRTKNINKKIVLTSGTFDLLHVGHINYIENVKKHGDILVVLLSGDKRVQGRKGLSRPIIPENERAKMLDSLKIVDYVLIDPAEYKPDQIDPVHALIISLLQPNFYVTDGKDIRFCKLMEKSKQVILPRTCSGKQNSTTAIIERIKLSS